MCFSAQASFVAAGCLTVGGLASLSQVTTKKQLPYAAVPLLFAAHQYIEGGIWLSVGRSDLSGLTTVLMYAFLFIAYCLWPVVFPLGILRIESNEKRRKVLKLCFYVGVGLSLYFLVQLFTIDASVKIYRQCVRYNFDYPYTLFANNLYAVPIAVAAILSTERFIKVLGVALTVAYEISYYYYAFAYDSVWCYYAAFLSLIIFAHLFWLKRANYSKSRQSEFRRAPRTS